MHLFLQSFIIREKFMSMVNLEKNLVSFCNTEVLQKSVMELAWGFCFISGSESVGSAWKGRKEE